MMTANRMIFASTTCVGRPAMTRMTAIQTMNAPKIPSRGQPKVCVAGAVMMTATVRRETPVTMIFVSHQVKISPQQEYQLAQHFFLDNPLIT